MLDFTTVTREFRGLVDRRREIYTFLGSVFAAMGLFLSNVLEGKLPDSLKPLQTYAFAFYALVLLAFCVVLALRMAKLHAGMTLNGILYARLMQNQTFTRPGDPEKAARHNFLGVSFLQFLMMACIAGFSAFVFVVANKYDPKIGFAAAGATGLFLLANYFRFHRQAKTFALKKASEDRVGLVNEDQWREHISLCLQQANHGLLSEIAFAGLMMFSCFGAMSGLGKIEAANLDLGADMVKSSGPQIFAGLMLFTCLVELLIYLRVRVAIGKFSLQLDPTDKPFRLFKLTDSMLGYLSLAFLFCVSLHVLLTMVSPELQQKRELLFIIDGIAFAAAVVAEQMTLAVAGRNAHSK